MNPTRFRPRFRLCLAPSDAGAGAAAAGANPAPKWHEALPEDLRTFVTAKGLAQDDPAAVLPKVLGIASAAEKRIGKGLDRILDAPAEGQAWSDWARANAKALGLPDAEDGYQIARPEGWADDLPWNDAMAEQARKIAHQHGLPPSALQAFTELYAGQVMQMNAAIDTQREAARTAMLGELEKDWGAGLKGKLALAQQGAQALVQASGLGDDALEVFTAALSPKLGDAAVMRMMAAVGEMLADDTAPGLGKGGNLGMSAAEARAALDTEFGPGSDWARAGQTRDHATIARLKPRFEQLSRVASSGR